MKAKAAPGEGRVLLELTGADSESVGRTVLPNQGSNRAFAMESILVPIDFSDCGRKALDYALAFAREFGARLTLVHVLPAEDLPGTDIPAIEFPLLQARLKKDTEVRLNAFAAAHVPGSVEMRTCLREGRAAHEIVAAAREMEADLIVLSTHGRTGLKHALLGSVAENVVRHAPCPVLVVREHEHDFVT